MLSCKDIFFNPFKFSFKVEQIPIILFFGALFLLNPTIALIGSFVVLLTTPSPTKGVYYLFYLLLASWMGVLNMTKEPVSDQIYYTLCYQNVKVSDINSFWTAVLEYRYLSELYLSFISYKEILFNFYSVVCHLLTGGNVRGYYFIITFNFYILHYFALHKILSASNRSKSDIICAVVLITFFSPLFIQTIHGVRQMLATSFLIYAIAYRTVEKRFHFPFLIISFFIHNTTLLYIVLSLIPYFYTKLSVKKTAILCIVFIILLSTYVKICLFFEKLDVIGLSDAASRVAHLDMSEKFAVNVRANMIYCIPTAIVALIIAFREYMNKGVKVSPMISFPYFFFITAFIVFGFSSAPTLQFRYMIYIFSFIPFILPFAFKTQEKRQKIYSWGLAIFFSCRFFFYDAWPSKYASMEDIISSSFYYFWTTTFYTI